jgi:hypothetical protein
MCHAATCIAAVSSCSTGKTLLTNQVLINALGNSGRQGHLYFVEDQFDLGRRTSSEVVADLVPGARLVIAANVSVPIRKCLGNGNHTR